MSIANWKEREKEQRQNDILSVTEKLFFKKGYEDVSMNDIAKEVGLGKSTLYFYFDNKESLFLAIVLRATRILSEMIKEAVEEEETDLKKLSAFKEAYNLFSTKYPGYYWAYKYFQSGRFDVESMVSLEHEHQVKTLVKQRSTKYPDSLDNISPANHYAIEIIELRREIFATVYRSIKKGIDEGIFRPEINPAETAVMLTIITEGVQNIQPDLVRKLEKYGIDQEKFKSDSKKFISYILLDK